MPPIECPHCLKKLLLPVELAGRAVRCVHCSGEFTAPATENEQYAPIREVRLTPQRQEQPGEGNEPCPRCGKLVWSEAGRCRHCGAELRDYDDRDDYHPWERGIRRDAEPHRAPTILALGIVSIVCSPMVPCCGVIGLAFAMLGLGMGIPSWIMGRRDLTKIQRGEMDPRGETGTRRGMICGMVGTILNVVGIFLIVLFYVAFFAWMNYQRSLERSAQPRPASVRKMMGAPLPGAW